MPFCKNCNQWVDGPASFCPHCGASLQDSAAEQPDVRTGTIYVPKDRLRVRRENDKTIHGSRRTTPNTVASFTFVESGQILAQVKVPINRDTSISFGREGCDVTVNPPSGTVSRAHGAILVKDGQYYIRDTGSLNGIYLNGEKQDTCRVTPGDIITVGPPRPGERRTVLVVGNASMSWATFDLDPFSSVSVGRLRENDLNLADPTVSAKHARIVRDATGDWTISDVGSFNGTQVNGRFIQPGEWAPLLSGSMITMGNAQLVFLDTCLLVFSERRGVDVVCKDLVRYRKNGGKSVITTDHISLHIKRGEFVAIVGGSGSGKSTLLNELNGSEPADEGSVFIDGTDLYANYEMLKTSIGYVPQQDIVYDNLTLESMLESAACLRMAPDTTQEERAARVDRIIDTLELAKVRHNMIGTLSGGQKKRASIAVELLADPRLLFLDEPTSGLDPGIERKLMQTLSDMAADGRTIILVTHTTLNLHLCDQVVFLGEGGKLCYAGRPAEAESFFDVNDLVDVYNKIGDDPRSWQKRFAADNALQSRTSQHQAELQSDTLHARPSLFDQFLTLSKRYVRLIMNDHSRRLLLLGQGPALALIISLVASKDCFDIYEKGKSCLFALSCAAFWMGIFNSIQEICKERPIFKREYEGGVRLEAYVASKVMVLGCLCILQTAMLTAVFLFVTKCLGHGSPNAGLFVQSGGFELFIEMTLLTISAMCLGLMVSAIFSNPERVNALVPLLIIPQILFAGVVFKLEGNANLVSYFVNCRWGMEALGTTLDLDSKDLSMYGKEITVPAQDRTIKDIEIQPEEVGPIDVKTDLGTQTVDLEEPILIEEKELHVDKQKMEITSKMLKHDPEELDNSMFEHTRSHLLRACSILVLFSVIGVLSCYLLLWTSVRHGKQGLKTPLLSRYVGHR